MTPAKTKVQHKSIDAIASPAKWRKRRTTPVSQNISAYEPLLALARLLGRQAAVEASRPRPSDFPTIELETIQ
jgi:hypothetical protein